MLRRDLEQTKIWMLLPSLHGHVLDLGRSNRVVESLVSAVLVVLLFIFNFVCTFLIAGPVSAFHGLNVLLAMEPHSIPPKNMR